jgi:hypothetical protein
VSAQDDPFTLLFRRLTNAMRIEHLEGTDDDAEHTNEKRIVWIPDGAALRSVPLFKRRQKETTSIFGLTFQVSVYAAHRTAALTLWTDLAGWIDLLVGPPQGAPDAGNGYAIGEANFGPRAGGNNLASSGYGIRGPITLNGQIIRRQLVAVPVTSVSLTLVVAPDLTGSDEEQILPPP